MVTAREKPRDELRTPRCPHTDPTPSSPPAPLPALSLEHRSRITSSPGMDGKEGEILEMGAGRGQTTREDHADDPSWTSPFPGTALLLQESSLTLLATLWGLFLWGTLPARLN